MSRSIHLQHYGEVASIICNLTELAYLHRICLLSKVSLDGKTRCLGSCSLAIVQSTVPGLVYRQEHAYPNDQTRPYLDPVRCIMVYALVLYELPPGIQYTEGFVPIGWFYAR